MFLVCLGVVWLSCCPVVPSHCSLRVLSLLICPVFGCLSRLSSLFGMALFGCRAFVHCLSWLCLKIPVFVCMSHPVIVHCLSGLAVVVLSLIVCPVFMWVLSCLCVFVLSLLSFLSFVDCHVACLCAVFVCWPCVLLLIGCDIIVCFAWLRLLVLSVLFVVSLCVCPVFACAVVPLFVGPVFIVFFLSLSLFACPL